MSARNWAVLATRPGSSKLVKSYDWLCVAVCHSKGFVFMQP